MLFEPVRKTQDAMFFVKTNDGMWVPCGPKQPGAVQTTMQELAAKGLASQVLLYAFGMRVRFLYRSNFICSLLII